MRLMAGVAELPARMFLGVDLREPHRLSDIFGMATNAKVSDIRLLRRNATGIVGVLCQGAMAGLAVHVSVHTLRFGIGDTRMAPFTGLVAGVNDGPRSDFRYGIPAKMTIAPEALGNEGAAKDEEEEQADEENRGHA